MNSTVVVFPFPAVDMTTFVEAATIVVDFIGFAVVVPFTFDAIVEVVATIVDPELVPLVVKIVGIVVMTVDDMPPAITVTFDCLTVVVPLGTIVVPVVPFPLGTIVVPVAPIVLLPLKMVAVVAVTGGFVTFAVLPITTVVPFPFIVTELFGVVPFAETGNAVVVAIGVPLPIPPDITVGFESFIVVVPFPVVITVVAAIVAFAAKIVGIVAVIIGIDPFTVPLVTAVVVPVPIVVVPIAALVIIVELDGFTVVVPVKVPLTDKTAGVDAVVDGIGEFELVAFATDFIVEVVADVVFGLVTIHSVVSIHSTVGATSLAWVIFDFIVVAVVVALPVLKIFFAVVVVVMVDCVAKLDGVIVGGVNVVFDVAMLVTIVTGVVAFDDIAAVAGVVAFDGIVIAEVASVVAFCAIVIAAVPGVVAFDGIGVVVGAGKLVVICTQGKRVIKIGTLTAVVSLTGGVPVAAVIDDVEFEGKTVLLTLIVVPDGVVNIPVELTDAIDEAVAAKVVC
uniref:Uncharacterized protein n=1 Tax=Panagrolaimus sp. JU765 TaxID=591449 RepID=A0AC34R495_9BILA